MLVARRSSEVRTIAPTLINKMSFSFSISIEFGSIIKPRRFLLTYAGEIGIITYCLFLYNIRQFKPDHFFQIL